MGGQRLPAQTENFCFCFEEIKAAHEGLTLEDANRVLLVLGEQGTSSGTDLGERKANPPDLHLIAQTVLANELQLGIETLLLERTPRWLRFLGEVTQLGTSHFSTEVQRPPC